jgi:broad specificity phosphatase PhoE
VAHRYGSAVDEVWLVRHGATEWSESGRHTSRTDLLLLPEGEDAARGLAPRLAAVDFALVLVSPRQRAVRTAELAGLRGFQIDPALVEWDYGSYEGLTRQQIRETNPDWSIWDDGAPGGESAADVAARVDRVIARVRSVDGRVLLIAHGHVLRALAVRWIGHRVDLGENLPLDTATVSVLSADRGIATIERWNT